MADQNQVAGSEAEETPDSIAAQLDERTRQDQREADALERRKMMRRFLSEISESHRSIQALEAGTEAYRHAVANRDYQIACLEREILALAERVSRRSTHTATHDFPGARLEILRGRASLAKDNESEAIEYLRSVQPDAVVDTYVFTGSDADPALDNILAELQGVLGESDELSYKISSAKARNVMDALKVDEAPGIKAEWPAPGFEFEAREEHHEALGIKTPKPRAARRTKEEKEHDELVAARESELEERVRAVFSVLGQGAVEARAVDVAHHFQAVAGDVFEIDREVLQVEAWAPLTREQWGAVVDRVRIETIAQAEKAIFDAENREELDAEVSDTLRHITKRRIGGKMPPGEAADRMRLDILCQAHLHFQALRTEAEASLEEHVKVNQGSEQRRIDENLQALSGMIPFYFENLAEGEDHIELTGGFAVKKVMPKNREVTITDEKSAFEWLSENAPKIGKKGEGAAARVLKIANRDTAERIRLHDSLAEHAVHSARIDAKVVKTLVEDGVPVPGVRIEVGEDKVKVSGLRRTVDEPATSLRAANIQGIAERTGATFREDAPQRAQAPSLRRGL